jgi:hypothetical protein
MDKRIRDKIDQFKKLATSPEATNSAVVSKSVRTSDSLSIAIHIKRDADIFMAELEAAIKQPE